MSERGQIGQDASGSTSVSFGSRGRPKDGECGRWSREFRRSAGHVDIELVPLQWECVRYTYSGTPGQREIGGIKAFNDLLHNSSSRSCWHGSCELIRASVPSVLCWIGRSMTRRLVQCARALIDFEVQVVWSPATMILGLDVVACPCDCQWGDQIKRGALRPCPDSMNIGKTGWASDCGGAWCSGMNCVRGVQVP